MAPTLCGVGDLIQHKNEVGVRQIGQFPFLQGFRVDDDTLVHCIIAGQPVDLPGFGENGLKRQRIEIGQ